MEAELLQAIGRARAVWRTPTTPLTLIIGTSVPTDLPIDRLVRSRELFQDATPIDAMMARGLLIEPGKGFSIVCAAAIGSKPKVVENLLRNSTGLRERIAARLVAPSGSSWKVKLAADDRYSVRIWIRDAAAGDEVAARTILKAFCALDPVELKPLKP